MTFLVAVAFVFGRIGNSWFFFVSFFFCARAPRGDFASLKVCKQVGKVSAPHAFSCLRWPGLAFKCLYLLRRLALTSTPAASISQLNRHSRGELRDTLVAAAHLSLPLSPVNERCPFGSRRVFMGAFGYS